MKKYLVIYHPTKTIECITILCDAFLSYFLFT